MNRLLSLILPARALRWGPLTLGDDAMWRAFSGWLADRLHRAPTVKAYRSPADLPEPWGIAVGWMLPDGSTVYFPQHPTWKADQ